MTTTIIAQHQASAPARPIRKGAVGARHLVGGFYLVMGGINAGIVAADPQTYETFAEGSFWSFVPRAWHDVVMTHPYFWFLLLAAGEVVLGLLLLRGGRAARAGWAGVITFQVLLMSFGFGFWLWSVPALALLVPAARADWPALGDDRRPATGAQRPYRARPSPPYRRNMDEPMTPLSTEQCWEFLRRHELGRLAFHLADEVHIVPINYAVDHEPTTGHPSLLFRTAEGSKLLGVVMNADVAFEVDELEGEHATSVVLRGRARRLEEDEEHRAENVPLRPWVATPKWDVVEIEVTEISGRGFDLTRPWRHVIIDET